MLLAAFSLVMAGWPPCCILWFVPLRVAFCWCCPRLHTSYIYISLCDFLWIVSGYISSFFFPFLFSLLSLICLHFSISLFPIIDYSDSTSCTHAVPPVPPRQTYPITRTITVKAKLWIKGMISPQWPMPWRGWVPLRLCQPCPAVQDPSPACMTASCSAQEARRPSRGWRWTLRKHTSTQCDCATIKTMLQIFRSNADKWSTLATLSVYKVTVGCILCTFVIKSHEKTKTGDVFVCFLILSDFTRQIHLSLLWICKCFGDILCPILENQYERDDRKWEGWITYNKYPDSVWERCGSWSLLHV